MPHWSVTSTQTGISSVLLVTLFSVPTTEIPVQWWMPPAPFRDKVRIRSQRKEQVQEQPPFPLPEQTRSSYSAKIQLWDDFIGRNFIASQQARSPLRMTQHWVPKRRIRWVFIQGNPCIHIKVSFDTSCVSGDIPAPVKSANVPRHTSHVQKWWKISAPGSRF